LRIIYREHSQQQLGLVRVPALGANIELVLLGLDDLKLELLELVPLSAPVALSNTVFARRKPVTHYVPPPMNI
jgi:hypothetical protein